MVMPATTHYSADMVRALPDDGNRYETVHGELLVSPAPSVWHQSVLTQLIVTLGPCLIAKGILGALLASPADISFDDDTLVQPDLFVAERGASFRTGAWADITTLHLVIEILSPSSHRADRTIKRRLYQEQRIPHYWIVDIEQRQVEIWTPDAQVPVIERERLTWRHPVATSECVVEVPYLFEVRA